MARKASQGRPFHTTRKIRWGRIKDCPFSKTHTLRLIDLGILFAAKLQIPGSRRFCTLVDLASLDRYLQQLGKEQREERTRQVETTSV